MANCPKCGNELSKKDSNFCSKCGAKIDSGENKKLKNDFNIDELEKMHNSKKSNKKLIVAIVIVVLIAIVAMFAFGVFTPADSSDDDGVVNTAESNVTHSKAAGEFLASSKSDKFHSPDCEWAGKISESNKVVYQSKQQAMEDGKIPCSVCNP